LLKKSEFLLIKLIVGDDNKAFLSVDDGNENVLAQARINFTDAQEGEWKFYLTDNVLLLPSEY
jgi:3-methyladenine DNA glycosylase Mpg